MFNLDDVGDTYWYPVSVELTDKEGKKQRFKFDAEFVRLPQDEITELFRKREEDEVALKDIEVLERVFRGWRGIGMADGRPLDVNEDNRDKLLNLHPVPSSITSAYLKSLGFEARAKN